MGHDRIGYFYVLIFIIGFGAITLVLTNPEMADVAKGVIKGGAGTANMAAVLVAKSVGGDVFFGFISAVAFATIGGGRRPHAVGRLGGIARPVLDPAQAGQGQQP